MSKKIYGFGYLGEGSYTSTINNTNTIQYMYWHDMLKRCYSEKYIEKHQTYMGCTVCEEWLNFQVFAKWVDGNFYTCNDERMELDKDIIFKSNKVYSPETCVFVPQRINKLFTKSNNIRGEYPIGVYKNENRFRARCSICVGKMKHIGYFDTPEKAFYDGYKPFKEDYIRQVANDYKDVIPQNLYEAMMVYVVEIND